ncbi:TIGR03986 family type III CRISPR-associated RAMP protein [Nocardiopsis ansamitocini]|uniref:CRISPR-associated RAMP family protein n=1 Tax=Nocardiopsis ansamitocini TaxID=1670832 RepID=A0A9W6P9G4_9ACTN|nr:TIGR03986 family CRISPR-associated RAMP protein [Nocardiopsis ansamitocini]GLU49432.1 CRISPR-associated RAMP family protein [Nocardiopsis ansamitocini]
MSTEKPRSTPGNIQPGKPNPATLAKLSGPAFAQQKPGGATARQGGPGTSGAKPGAGVDRRLAADAPPPEPGANPGTDFHALAPYGAIPLPETPMPATRLQASALDLLGPDASPDALLRSHDSRLPGTHTGWIDLEIRALTPLFVGTTQDERQEGEPPPVARSAHVENRPVIPGASLRGLLRNELRLLTGGETGPVNTPQLFFRAPVDLRPDSVKNNKEEYRTRLVGDRLHKQYKKIEKIDEKRKVSAGFLVHRESGWSIVELAAKKPWTISFKAIRASLAERSFGYAERDFPDPPRDNTYVPAEHHSAFQYRRVWAMLKPEELTAFLIAPTEETAKKKRAELLLNGERGTEIRQCVLVLTGAAGEPRNNAYLFPIPTGFRDGLPVDEGLIRLFESAEQITKYQQKNFHEELSVTSGDPERPPLANGRGGGLPRRSLEPVWFQTVDGTVVSFGRSGGYRVAVGDFDPLSKVVPAAVLGPQECRSGHRAGETERPDRDRPADVPRAIFGDIDLLAEDEGKRLAARGRVSVGAALSESTDVEFTDPLRVELLSPQRGCFANYLVQPHPGFDPKKPLDLVTWSHEGDVRLGGYKVYLHRHDEQPTGPRANDRHAQLRPKPETDPLATERDVRPVREGTVFHGRLTFTNLAEAELGALMRALLLGNPADGGAARDPRYAHKIGMGKPLGLGSVHITPRLHLVDATERTRSLDPLAGVRAVDDAGVEKLLAAFDDALLEWERGQPVKRGESVPQRWEDVPRVRERLCAAQWRERLPESWTRTMTLDEFKRFPVLPAVSERFARHRQHGRPRPGRTTA